MYSLSSNVGSTQDCQNMAYREHVMIKHKSIPIKSQKNPFKLAIEARQNRKVWTVRECESIIANCTNPIGKFLRGMNTSAAQAVALNLMPYLMEAPSKPRVKYGQRRAQTNEERIQLAKERNREHARRTRRRRTVFKKVTEACRFLSPLPYLENNDYSSDSSDSEDNENNDLESSDIIRTASLISPSDLLDISSADNCDQALTALSSTNMDRNEHNKYESRSYLNSNFAHEANSATVDIMELDSADKSVATQFSILGASSTASVAPISATYQLSNFLDCSRSPNYDEGQATYDLIKYLAVLFPSILEARRFCHGVPLLKPDFNESPEAGYAYGYECKKFQLNIINYTGTSPSLSTPSTAHSTTTDCLSKLIPRRLCDTRSYLRDVIASEARLLLSALLHELQEGLVVKLLLPTEPTTPALPTSISVSRINSRTDNRASFLAATSQQDCWQENRPLLQRFKNLFSFGDKSHTNEPQLKSPDSVAYGNDDFLSSSRTLLGNNLVTVEEILSVKHGQNLPQNHDLNHLYPPNIVIASSAGDYDYDSQFSDGLQPISPICSGEDVTSVQLLLIRIHLDSHISSQTTSNKVDIIEYFTAAVTIDYAIKVQGSENGKQRDTGTCVESLISSVDNDSYTFKNARIASLPCQSKSPQTPFKIMAMPLDKKLPSIDEPLSAAIALSTQCSTYEVAVELDFEFLLAELMTIVSNTLRSMST